MHVTIPNPVAPNDHDRITNLAPVILELVDLAVFKVQKVHHLITQVSHRKFAVRIWGPHRHCCRKGLIHGVATKGVFAERHWFAFNHIERGIKQQHETSASSINDTSIFENWQQFWSLIKSHSARVARCPQSDGQSRPRGSRGFGGFAGLTNHGQDRALNRL